MMNSDKSDRNEERYDILRKTSPSGYDELAEFDKLTYEQRSMWLSQCVQFYWGRRDK